MHAGDAARCRGGEEDPPCRGTCWFCCSGTKTAVRSICTRTSREGRPGPGPKPSGSGVEVVFSSAFGQYRVVRKRLGDTARPLDAVIMEPATVANMELILKDLQGRTGVVLVNAWDPLVETYCRGWGSELPFGTISMPHTKFGELQGRQVSSVVPQGESILVVTGPSRASSVGRAAPGPQVHRPLRHPGLRHRRGPVERNRGCPRVRRLVRRVQEPARDDRGHRGAERRPRRGRSASGDGRAER